MKNQFGLVIQARMASTRLPGKVLRTFCGRPMLGYQIDLLRKMPKPFPIVIATSLNPKDDALETFCKKEAIAIFRGDEEDVFSRYQGVALQYAFDNLIRLTADNPLVHEEILNACIEAHLKSGADITSTREILSGNVVLRYCPKGLSVDVMRGRSLLALDGTKLNAFEKEHVIPVFFNGNHTVTLVKQFASLSPISYSVDTEEDWERVSALAKKLGTVTPLNF